MMHRDPIGPLGAVACCPNCCSLNIEWDANTGVSICKNCNWGNWSLALQNNMKRYLNGEISLVD